jgi:hypothetical protein
MFICCAVHAQFSAVPAAAWHVGSAMHAFFTLEHVSPTQLSQAMLKAAQAAPLLELVDAEVLDEDDVLDELDEDDVEVVLDALVEDELLVALA